MNNNSILLSQNIIDSYVCLFIPISYQHFNPVVSVLSIGFGGLLLMACWLEEQTPPIVLLLFCRCCWFSSATQQSQYTTSLSFTSKTLAILLFLYNTVFNPSSHKHWTLRGKEEELFDHQLQNTFVFLWITSRTTEITRKQKLIHLQPIV